MGMEALKTMKTQLEGCVQGQLGNLDKVDAHELGEAVDMVKDLEEAIYYCTIVEAMHKEKTNSEDISPINNTYYYLTTYDNIINFENHSNYFSCQFKCRNSN